DSFGPADPSRNLARSAFPSCLAYDAFAVGAGCEALREAEDAICLSQRRNRSSSVSGSLRKCSPETTMMRSFPTNVEYASMFTSSGPNTFSYMPHQLLGHFSHNLSAPSL